MSAEKRTSLWAVCLGCVLLLVGPGCKSPGLPQAGAEGAEPAWTPDSVPFGPSQGGPAQQPQAGPLVSLVVTFDLLRIEVAAGAISTSQTLWNHLDEEAVGSERALLLRRNGFRVGLGQPGAWPAVEAILGASQPVLSRRKVLSLRGPQPVSIEDGQAPRDQTVFYYRGDGTLVGQSLADSRNLLRVDHQVEPASPEAVVLQVTPIVYQTDLGLQWLRTAAGLEKVPAYDGLAIEDLSFRVRLPAGCFLLIASGPEAVRPGLIGREVMSAAGREGRYEFIYVIWARVIRTEVQPG